MLRLSCQFPCTDWFAEASLCMFGVKLTPDVLRLAPHLLKLDSAIWFVQGNWQAKLSIFDWYDGWCSASSWYFLLKGQSFCLISSDFFRGCFLLLYCSFRIAFFGCLSCGTCFIIFSLIFTVHSLLSLSCVLCCIVVFVYDFFSVQYFSSSCHLTCSPFSPALAF